MTFICQLDCLQHAKQFSNAFIVSQLPFSYDGTWSHSHVARNVVSPYLRRHINLKGEQAKQVRSLLTLHEPTGSLPVFGQVRVAHLFSFPCMYCVLCFVCLRTAFCVPNIANVSGLSILDCQCFGIVHSSLPLRISLTFLFQQVVYNIFVQKILYIKTNQNYIL